MVHPTTSSIEGVNADAVSPWLLFVAAGLIGGIVLFVRGLQAYRRDRLISSVATSSLDGIAAGEVRVSGTVEPLDQTLISPLQSKPCVWYRARVETTGDNSRVLLDEEKSQEFRLRNETGAIRVVPRGARWEIGAAFDERTSLTGAEPIGLERRRGAAYAPLQERDVEQMTELERQTAAQALLTVQRPTADAFDDDWSGGRRPPRRRVRRAQRPALSRSSAGTGPDGDHPGPGVAMERGARRAADVEPGHERGSGHRR